MGAGLLGSPDRPAPLDDHAVCDAGVMQDRRSDGYQSQINPIAPMSYHDGFRPHRRYGLPDGQDRRLRGA